MNINIKSIVLIGIALAVAGVTAFLARSLVTTPEAEQTVIVQQEVSEVQILVSNRDITTGSFLKKEDLIWQSWPDDNVNEHYFQKQTDAQAEEQTASILGSVAKAPIAAGEPFVEGRIVKPGSRGFMAAVLMPGHRAVSININSRTGLSGFIFPGDNVDILLTHVIEEEDGDEETSSEIQATETVLRNIRVLAIDTQMSNDTNTPSVGKIATFEVTSKQAEKIALMSRMGELSLALRSLASENVDGTPGAGSAGRSNVTYASEVSAVVAEQTGMSSDGRRQIVKIVRASDTEDIIFKNTNNR